MNDFLKKWNETCVCCSKTFEYPFSGWRRNTIIDIWILYFPFTKKWSYFPLCLLLWTAIHLLTNWRVWLLSLITFLLTNCYSTVIAITEMPRPLQQQLYIYENIHNKCKPADYCNHKHVINFTEAKTNYDMV